MMKSKFLIPLLIAVLLIGCGGGGGDSSPPYVPPVVTPPSPAIGVTYQDCANTPGGTQATNVVLDKFGIYSVVNDQWGTKTNLTPGISLYECVTGVLIADNVLSATWSWKMDEENGTTVVGNAKAYPAIIAGRSPNIGKPTIPTKRVVDTQNTSVKYEVQINKAGRSSTFFNVTFTSTADGLLKNLTTDIAIAVTPSQVPISAFAGATIIEEISIDGQNYQVISIALTEPLPRRSIWFNILQPNLANTMHVKPFVDYMVSKGYLNTNDYLAGIQFGTEVIAGEGDIVVKEFIYTP